MIETLQQMNKMSKKLLIFKAAVMMKNYNQLRNSIDLANQNFQVIMRIIQQINSRKKQQKLKLKLLKLKIEYNR